MGRTKVAPNCAEAEAAPCADSPDMEAKKGPRASRTLEKPVICE